MKIRVQLFAALAEQLGGPALDVELPGEATSMELLQHLQQAFPQSASLLAASRVAIDQSFAIGPVPFAESSEVAIIPPVSGG